MRDDLALRGLYHGRLTVEVLGRNYESEQFALFAVLELEANLGLIRRGLHLMHWRERILLADAELLLRFGKLHAKSLNL